MKTAYKPVDASDEGQIAERTARSKSRDAIRIDGLKQIMTTPPGRAWMWDLLGKCGIYRTSFTGNSETFYREGSRNIGLQVLADINKEFPDTYLQMLKENQ